MVWRECQLLVDRLSHETMVFTLDHGEVIDRLWREPYLKRNGRWHRLEF